MDDRGNSGTDGSAGPSAALKSGLRNSADGAPCGKSANIPRKHVPTVLQMEATECETCQLVIEDFDDHPQLQGERLVMAHDDFTLLLFYDAGSE